MCRHSYHSKGHKTFSANVPLSAQGCYFPGDEPGLKCKHNYETCYLEYEAGSPELCEVQIATDCICPDCGGAMKMNGNDVVYCPDCGYRE